MTACQNFLLHNFPPSLLFTLIRLFNISLYYSFSAGVAMNAHWYVTSRRSNIFLSHLNMLKQLVTFWATEGSLFYSSFNYVILFIDTSTELFYDKVSVTMLRSDLLTSVEIFSDKFLCTMIYFDLSLSVTLMFKDRAVISV